VFVSAPKVFQENIVSVQTLAALVPRMVFVESTENVTIATAINTAFVRKDIQNIQSKKLAFATKICAKITRTGKFVAETENVIVTSATALKTSTVCIVKNVRTLHARMLIIPATQKFSNHVPSACPKQELKMKICIFVTRNA